MWRPTETAKAIAIEKVRPAMIHGQVSGCSASWAQHLFEQSEERPNFGHIRALCPFIEVHSQLMIHPRGASWDELSRFTRLRMERKTRTERNESIFLIDLHRPRWLPITTTSAIQSDASLFNHGMRRFLHDEPIERCEDPLIDAKRLQLFQSDWRKLTPSRFKDMLQHPPDAAPPTTIVQYSKNR
ncbi:hypothetical protein BDY19DRAFT_4716 [Irpex rosettiformis]|uniref:Uncharacterized protein n=1 Tax=Irpex rosettiformis TaxID=378272 RepID=A0ACB8UIJ4_9APHY|nr:hypothetical protein BDY19DRAFT_4716 [Irpex rosettiformis]